MRIVGFQFNSQRSWRLCQTMNDVISKPVLSADVTKAFLIVHPSPLKVCLVGCETSLYHSPSPTVRGLVTVDQDSSQALWVDSVLSACISSQSFEFVAVVGCRKVNDNVTTNLRQNPLG